MFYDGMVDCSDKQNSTNTSTMATTSSNYWTATATATAPRVTQVLQHKTPEQEEEERWNQHKFGLCPLCKKGLDDRADFTFNYTRNKENGTMICFDCDTKVKLNRLKLK
jgi:hypothetical protein